MRICQCRRQPIGPDRNHGSNTGNDRLSGHRLGGKDHFSGQTIQKTTFLEENELVLPTGFEDKKGLNVFPLNRSLTVFCLRSQQNLISKIFDEPNLLTRRQDSGKCMDFG